MVYAFAVGIDEIWAPWQKCLDCIRGINHRVSGILEIGVWDRNCLQESFFFFAMVSSVVGGWCGGWYNNDSNAIINNSATTATTTPAEWRTDCNNYDDPDCNNYAVQRFARIFSLAEWRSCGLASGGFRQCLTKSLDLYGGGKHVDGSSKYAEFFFRCIVPQVFERWKRSGCFFLRIATFLRDSIVFSQEPRASAASAWFSQC